MLLEVDGLDQHWDGINASTSAWENELGNLDEADVPLAISRILTPSEIRDYDSSSVGNSQIQDKAWEMTDRLMMTTVPYEDPFVL